MNPRGILFDLYGTLLIFGDLNAAWEAWLQAFYQAMRGLGMEVEEADFRRRCDGFFSWPEPAWQEDGLTVAERRFQEFCAGMGHPLEGRDLREVVDGAVTAWQRHVDVDPEAAEVLEEAKSQRPLALVTNFDHPCGFTRQDVLVQARQFRERFGRDSVCGVNHCVRWTGWAEPARWMLAAGNKGDNSFFGWTSPPNNPVNTLGFVHGSAFPRRIWEDAEHGNARLDFLEIPITGYEVGYADETFIPEKVQQALDLALRYRLTLEFFYHPVYIAQYPACRQAIDELVRLIGELPVPPILMGLDQLYHWWTAREQAVIQDARQSEKNVTFKIDCAWEDGYVARIPTGEAPPAECLVDDSPADFETAVEFGQRHFRTALGVAAICPIGAALFREHADLYAVIRLRPNGGSAANQEESDEERGKTADMVHKRAEENRVRKQ